MSAAGSSRKTCGLRSVRPGKDSRGSFSGRSATDAVQLGRLLSLALNQCFFLPADIRRSMMASKQSIDNAQEVMLSAAAVFEDSVSLQALAESGFLRFQIAGMLRFFANQLDDVG